MVKTTKITLPEILKSKKGEKFIKIKGKRITLKAMLAKINKGKKKKIKTINKRNLKKVLTTFLFGAKDQANLFDTIFKKKEIKVKKPRRAGKIKPLPKEKPKTERDLLLERQRLEFEKKQKLEKIEEDKALKLAKDNVHRINVNDKMHNVIKKQMQTRYRNNRAGLNKIANDANIDSDGTAPQVITRLFDAREKKTVQFFNEKGKKASKKNKGSKIYKAFDNKDDLQLYDTLFAIDKEDREPDQPDQPEQDFNENILVDNSQFEHKQLNERKTNTSKNRKAKMPDMTNVNIDKLAQRSIEAERFQNFQQKQEADKKKQEALNNPKTPTRKDKLDSRRTRRRESRERFIVRATLKEEEGQRNTLIEQGDDPDSVDLTDFEPGQPDAQHIKEIAAINAEVGDDPTLGLYVSKSQEGRSAKQLSKAGQGNSAQLGGLMDDPNDALNNHEINKIMDKYNNYTGTHPKDHFYKALHDIQPKTNGGAILNLDTSDMPGSHWVAAYWDGRPNGSHSIEYYDSFGRQPPKEIKDELLRIPKKLQSNQHLKLKVNSIQKQDNKSVSCGYHAMNFLMNRFRGKPFKSATGFNNISKNEDKMDKLKSRFEYLI